MIRRSWVEIDLEQIKLNYNIYKKSTSKNIMAVVKADAYGHGAVKVAKLLQEEGVQNFAVSNVKEELWQIPQALAVVLPIQLPTCCFFPMVRLLNKVLFPTLGFPARAMTGRSGVFSGIEDLFL